VSTSRAILVGFAMVAVAILLATQMLPGRYTLQGPEGVALRFNTATGETTTCRARGSGNGPEPLSLLGGAAWVAADSADSAKRAKP
jgi:hypothetical protein